ncbi:hypothetical protein Rhopal_001660-T1 [Rhodotorula paludigena]|uniref:Uncharacterized protein n=1 Tax=Rhodotorula paludigena TaxID=86838 RepID=A0AAV5GFP3_9BASI|nr:hypothetical protein Rhopal_001660-T1 [Rhodotorula paludigena]
MHSQQAFRGMLALLFWLRFLPPVRETIKSVQVPTCGARLRLLMRDTTAAVVVRALQADAIISILDILSAGACYLEGSLSREVALGTAGFAGSFLAYALYLLK